MRKSGMYRHEFPRLTTGEFFCAIPFFRRIGFTHPRQTMREVMNMLPEIELLQYIHKTADMGCQGLDAVIGRAEEPLRAVLRQQRAEYEDLRERAAEQIHARGREAGGVGMAAKASARVMTEGKLALDSSASKIAEMNIEGTSMGVAKTIRHLHDYRGDDEQARGLGERLLKTQQDGIEQMKAFL